MPSKRPPAHSRLAQLIADFTSSRTLAAEAEAGTVSGGVEVPSGGSAAASGRSSGVTMPVSASSKSTKLTRERLSELTRRASALRAGKEEDGFRS